MNYETMDWEAEAGRIASAFDLDTDKIYKFNEFPIAWEKNARFFQEELKKGLLLIIFYKGLSVEFSVGRPYISSSIIELSSSGDVLTFKPSAYNDILAKGLLRIDLLSPQVENALNITQHQKIEWGLEYESQIRNRVIDLFTKRAAQLEHERLMNLL